MESKASKILVSLIESGMLENRVLADMHIEEEDIEEVKRKNMSLMGDKKYVILVVSDSGGTISSDARRLTASPEFQQNTLAKAFLVDNLPHRIIGNFYLSFNRPAIPTRIFNDREKAMEWLRSELKRGDFGEKQTNSGHTVFL